MDMGRQELSGRQGLRGLDHDVHCTVKHFLTQRWTTQWSCTIGSAVSSAYRGCNLGAAMLAKLGINLKGKQSMNERREIPSELQKRGTSINTPNPL